MVLKDGPTRDALRNKAQGNEVRGFALLPKIARPVGPRAPNRPQDRRVLQGKLASLGYAPRVTEKPLFAVSAAGQPATPPFHPPGGGKAPDDAGGLQALLDAVAAFQRNKRLKEDRLVTPGGPTERALDAQNERARLDRLETVLPGGLRAIDQGTLRVIQNKSQRRYNIEHNGYIVSIAPSFAKDNTIQWVVTGFKRGNPKLTDNPFNIRYLKHGLFFRH